MIFYTGLHKPWQAKHFAHAFISANRMRTRRVPLGCPDWIMDSGAFTELQTHGRYRQGVEAYAELVNRIAAFDPGLTAVVAQDFMCESLILDRTGLTIGEHQRLTIDRYDQLLALSRVQIIPVLQGFRVEHYLQHLEIYGDRLAPGAYFGVGTLCKRNGAPYQVEAILTAIKIRRPDLRLHGFGLKTTSLRSDLVQRCLHSADSMAWSYAARREGRNRNDWSEALAFSNMIEMMPVQQWMFPE